MKVKPLGSFPAAFGRLTPGPWKGVALLVSGMMFKQMTPPEPWQKRAELFPTACPDYYVLEGLWKQRWPTWRICNDCTEQCAWRNQQREPHGGLIYPFGAIRDKWLGRARRILVYDDPSRAASEQEWPAALEIAKAPKVITLEVTYRELRAALDDPHRAGTNEAFLVDLWGELGNPSLPDVDPIKAMRLSIPNLGWLARRPHTVKATRWRGFFTVEEPPVWPDLDKKVILFSDRACNERRTGTSARTARRKRSGQLLSLQTCYGPSSIARLQA